MVTRDKTEMGFKNKSLGIKMDKYTIISIIAIFVLVLTVGFSVLNVLAAESLQFRGADASFTFFGFNENGTIEVCNSLPFFTTGDKLEIFIYSDKEVQGIFSFDEFTIFPMSSSIIKGSFTSDSYAESTYLFFHFDGMFSGSTPLRINPSKIIVVTEIQTPIIGVIPYSVTKQYSSLEFWDMMNDKNGVYSC